MRETQVRSLGWKDPLQKGMATHSGILTWRIPWTRGAWQATVHVVARLGQDLATKPTNQGNSAFQKVVIPQRLFIHHFCLIGQIFCDVINLS